MWVVRTDGLGWHGAWHRVFLAPCIRVAILCCSGFVLDDYNLISLAPGIGNGLALSVGVGNRLNTTPPSQRASVLGFQKGFLAVVFLFVSLRTALFKYRQCKCNKWK